MILSTTNKYLSLAAGTAIATIAVVSANAQEIKPGFYSYGDVGLNLMQDMPVANSPGIISVNPGVRFDLGIGYGIVIAPKWTLGVELEPGFLYNSLDKGTVYQMTVPLGGEFWQVPVMGNVVINYHAGRWVPYVGVGGGASYSEYTLTSVGGFQAAQSESFNGFNAAYQAMAGIRCDVNDHWSVGVDYKFMESFYDLLVDPKNHSFMASVTYRF